MTSQIPGAHCAIFRAGVVSRIMDRAGAGSKAKTTPHLAARNPCRPVQTFPFVARWPSPSLSDETRTEVTVRYLQRRLASVRTTGRGRAGFLEFLIGGGCTSAGDRWQRVVRYSRCTNLFGPFKAARRSFRSLRHALQKPRRVFAVLFRPSLSFGAFHGPNHGAGNVGKIRKGIGHEFR